MKVRNVLALCCLVALCHAAALADSQAESRRLRLRQRERHLFDKKVGEKRIEYEKQIEALKLDGKAGEIEDKQLEFQQWLEKETLLYQQGLKRIDLEAAVSATAGLCLAQGEFLRRRDVYADWDRQKEDLRHAHALQKKDLERKHKKAAAARPEEIAAAELEYQRAVELENNEHQLNLGDITHNLAREKEQIMVRKAGEPYADLRLRYAQQHQDLQWEHQKAVSRKGLEHKHALADLQRQAPNPAVQAEIAEENLNYQQWLAMENLVHSHQLASSNPHYMILASTGGVGSELRQAWLEAEAQWDRDEENLRHEQAEETAALKLSSAPITFANNPQGLERFKVEHRYALQLEEHRHKVKLQQIELRLAAGKDKLRPSTGYYACRGM